MLLSFGVDRAGLWIGRRIRTRLRFKRLTYEQRPGAGEANEFADEPCTHQCGLIRRRSLPLHVIIHRELVRMGAETERVVFLLFHIDPVCDEVFVEDVAAQQEGMIGLERFDCAAE